MSVRKEEGDKHAYNVITCQVMTDGFFIPFYIHPIHCSHQQVHKRISNQKIIGVNVDACQYSPNMQVDSFSVAASELASPYKKTQVRIQTRVHDSRRRRQRADRMLEVASMSKI